MKKIIVATAISMFAVSSLFGAGTQAGTDINNTATLSYSAGGVAQPPKDSNEDSFKVDRKIDFLVAHQDSTPASVVPGQAKAVLTYVVANNGNEVQDFSLSSLANDGNPFGLTDNFDSTDVSIYVDTNDNGTYDEGTDTETYIDELAADTNKTVFIVSNIPLDRVDGDVAEYTLVAQVAEGGTSGAQGSDITSDDKNNDDTATGVETVFADAAGANNSTDGGEKNGKHSDNDAYKVVVATLDMTKTSCVISDPVNGGTKPKRIPGAVIRYMLDINNTGSADANDITITDDLVSDLDYSTLETPNDNVHTNIGDTACDCSNPGGGTASTVNNTGNDPQVKLEGIDVAKPAAGESENHTCVYFEVEVK